jgi:dihydrofolate reductase
MRKVFLDVSVSLDGYVAGPADDVSRLHDWIFDGQLDRTGMAPRTATGASADLIAEMFARSGAVLMGRRTFDVAEHAWGQRPPFAVPCFILTHRLRDELVRSETTFEFVDCAASQALELARSAAGDQDVSLMGASVGQQCLRAGLVDELRLHLVPVLLGAGTRLFDSPSAAATPEPSQWRLSQVLAGPGVTHLAFERVDAPGLELQRSES